MRNRVYHFHPKEYCKGGVTVVYEPTRNVFAVARCSSTDTFSRKAGIRICETRLQTAPVASPSASPNSFQSHVFAGQSFGIGVLGSPSPQEISAVAYLLAERVANNASDVALSRCIAQNGPQIDTSLRLSFSKGMEQVGWTKPAYCGEPSS